MLRGSYCMPYGPRPTAHHHLEGWREADGGHPRRLPLLYEVRRALSARATYLTSTASCPTAGTAPLTSTVHARRRASSGARPPYLQPVSARLPRCNVACPLADRSPCPLTRRSSACSAACLSGRTAVPSKPTPASRPSVYLSMPSYGGCGSTPARSLHPAPHAAANAKRAFFFSVKVRTPGSK
jgi:hypothetical protein